MPKRRSFFERLTGTVNLRDGYEEEAEMEEQQIETTVRDTRMHAPQERERAADRWMEEESSEGQLSVDVYQTADEIIVKAIVAGVKPDDLDVSISRDMVTIRGKREEYQEVEDADYFYRELYWGSFSRTILLPQEIEVEEAQATEKHGLLVIRLPKIDKDRQAKIKVKSA